MKKQVTIFLMMVGVFLIANKVEAKINSYDYSLANGMISLYVDGFIPSGQSCTPHYSSGGGTIQTFDSTHPNIVVNNNHVLGTADIVGTTLYNGYLVDSCSDSRIDISTLYFGNLGIGTTGTVTIKVGTPTMSTSDEVTVCMPKADTWQCGDWDTCSPQGVRTRTCNKTFDCPSADTPSPSISQSCTYVAPTCNAWTYSDWGQCSASEQQTRTIVSSSPNGCVGGSPILSQSCTCTSWTYSNWSVCSEAEQQTRTVSSSSPSGCVGGNPALSQSCTYTPLCTINSWKCGDWNSCTADSKQMRSCTKTNTCEGGVASPITMQSCTYIAPACASWTYSGWSICSSAGQQTRNILSSTPAGCAGGNPILQQSCTPSCSADTWTCGSWNQCTSNGTQTRSCTRSFDCPTAETLSPTTSQNCTPPQPTCNADTWTCGGWDVCSLSGIQNRSCQKTFDCPSVETAPPMIAQSCETPNRPQQTPPPDSGEVTNQDTIVKATVKLLCPVDARMANQGSGTVIDPSGTILTNKHVIAGTVGCLVGFVDDFGDEPYFGDRQIADIAKTSPTQDIAILKLRNPQNKRLSSVSIAGASSNLRLGTRVVTYGYPASFGRNMTYTSGDFSGSDGAYLKTTAIIEHGNSGGGAYLTNGTYIGIPSMVRKGELNALGYILSINTINGWINNSGVAYGGGSNNQYSRVSVLEDMDLKTLGSLKLFIPQTDATGALVKPVSPAKTPEVPKVIDQPKVEQQVPKVAEQKKTNQKTPEAKVTKPQEESTVIESGDNNKVTEAAPQQNKVKQEKEQKPKASLPKRFFSWMANLFSRLAK